MTDRVPTPQCPIRTEVGSPTGVSSGLSGPSGLGTSAARVATQLARDPGYVEREWGDGTAPPLYCPVVERIDPALAEEVDDRLVVWAKDCGFTDDQRDLMRAAGFGRLAMLTHTDTEDPDRLL